MLAAALCNNAELRLTPAGMWTVMGDPTEGALLTVAAKGGYWWQELQKRYYRHRKIPFSSARRMMTVLYREPDGGYIVFAKGAPDTVLDHCNLEESSRGQVLAANEKMARKALRVLAVAYKKVPPGDGDNPDTMDCETELVFCGLIGMSDSPREGVGDAIKKCHNAGIKVVMITGDHQKTAEAVAEKLGILKQGKSINGQELELIPETEFARQVENIVVYSRTTPDQKLRIVRALKKRGQIVAMTGDGVNDAPAVKEAHIGIAMGRTGTDVTKEVAGMVQVMIILSLL